MSTRSAILAQNLRSSVVMSVNITAVQHSHIYYEFLVDMAGVA